ncbi:hypothetical protein B0H63DRAFT_526754 [Podospora didyma]|uniref:Putative zinc-finger domain-containing protein n=1 Tax=Podospora didyma TaxID=330526 RepID=A0AAE0N6F2_9PEZI|nr:hypothetical protein B0H63DRAFT_526754 [Podospora didyma]
MSHYPYSYGYGQYQGQPRPHQPYGAYQPPSGYPAPPFNPSYNANAADINQNVSQGSFDYNASHIPGLGITGATAGGSTPQGSWPPPPPFTAGALHISQPTQTPGSFGAQRFHTTQSSEIIPVQSTRPPILPAQLEAWNEPGHDMEEGELSEGQFEDLYEVRSPVRPKGISRLPPKPPSTTNLPRPPSVTNPSRPPSAAETPDAGFYANDEEEGEITTGGKVGAVPAHERSGSYSPFPTPREVQTGASTPQQSADHAHLRQKPAPTGTAEPRAVVPGLQYTPQQTASGSGSARPSSASASAEPTLPFKSLIEAKKEAQKAVLKLCSLGVKYHHYIEEGIDEKVVKNLYQELRLDLPKEVTASPASGEEAQPRPDTTKALTKPQAPDNQQHQTAVANQSVPGKEKGEENKGEERKDRIARLLAAKAAKSAKAPVASTASNPPPKPQAGPSPPVQQISTQKQQEGMPSDIPTGPRAKTWGSKEQIIRQRMAALQKAREAHPQKSSDAGSATAPSGGRELSAPASQRAAQTTAPEGSGMASRPGPGSSQMPQGPPNLSLATPSIPGLLLSSAQLGQSAIQRKRPVAADFVDYSTAVAPPKQPFGKDRTQSSLVIDISDGSDNEEMDMDMESSVDDPWPIRTSAGTPLQSSGTPSQRGPSIRDFPPLSDIFPQRPPFSSGPSPSHTPPGPATNGRKRESELDIKEKQIQEFKRRIAEMEAKKKAKNGSVGSQTPSQTCQTPDLKENQVPQQSLGAPQQHPEARQQPSRERVTSMGSSDVGDGPSAQLISEAKSANLPKPSELPLTSGLERAQRIGKIVSVDLTQIDVSLQEKMDRLRQVREEEAQLQAEIDRSLAAKKLLTEELEQLKAAPSEVPSAGTPHPNGLSSDHSSRGPASRPGSLSVEPQTTTESETPQRPEEPSDDGDISMDEDESSRTSSRRESVSQEPSQRQQSTGSNIRPTNVAQSEDMSKAPSVNPSSYEQDESTESTDAALRSATGDSPDLQGHAEPPMPMDIIETESSAEEALLTAGEELNIAVDDSRSSVSQDQAGSTGLDDTSPMELESPSPSPSRSRILSQVPADITVSHELSDHDVPEVRQPSAPSLNQISTVTQPREEIQEMEVEAARDVNKATSKQDRVFMPYDSPLRYFHAYRFHSAFQDSIPGGLKSLTYSHNIDPAKPICPHELDGKQCLEPNCEFQHFGSIKVPDDYILRDLGKADEYEGEQKSRFIQGLRKLLQDFRNGKVKDFDTIAHGIIDYRFRFLGDKSKILPLEGIQL